MLDTYPHNAGHYLRHDLVYGFLITMLYELAD